MKQHSGNAISISVIGGADGPTSIFVAGPGEKRALKARIRDSIYRYKRKRAEKRIVAAPHSLAETVLVEILIQRFHGDVRFPALAEQHVAVKKENQ